MKEHNKGNVYRNIPWGQPKDEVNGVTLNLSMMREYPRFVIWGKDREMLVSLAMDPVSMNAILDDIIEVATLKVSLNRVYDILNVDYEVGQPDPTKKISRGTISIDIDDISILIKIVTPKKEIFNFRVRWDKEWFTITNDEGLDITHSPETSYKYAITYATTLKHFISSFVANYKG